MPISESVFLDCVAQARLTPSAHNTQPARFGLLDPHTVIVADDPTRQLHAGDPSGRDQDIAVGAAIEGLHLALTQHGRGIANLSLEPVSLPKGLRFRALAKLSDGYAPDPLSKAVGLRSAFRGRFVEAQNDQLTRLSEMLEALERRDQ